MIKQKYLFILKSGFVFKIAISLTLLTIFNKEINSQISNETLEQHAANLENNGNINGALEYYNKAAYSYWNTNFVDKAISCFEKTLELSKSSNNTKGIYNAVNNLGLLYSEKDNYSKALEFFTSALDISRKNKNVSEIPSNLYNVASALQSSGKYKESFDFLNELLKRSQEENNLKLILKSYSYLAIAYEKTGASAKAFEYYEKFKALDSKLKKDEIEKIQSEANTVKAEKAATEIKLNQTTSTLRQTSDSLDISQRIAKEQKMQNELISSKLREEENKLKYEKKIRRVQSYTISIISLLLISLLFMFLQKRKDNRLLKQKNFEIEKQKEEISEQNIKLERQNNNIRDSIHYAKNIQSTILPESSLLDNLAENFIIYLPKDIVSGDFYWFDIINDNPSNWKAIFAVVDCTGHGVPGAFMSLIGNRLLNEITDKKGIFTPSEILNTLNQNLKVALKQDTGENEDGMDVCICTVEKNENKFKIIYSGAKRPLIHWQASTDEIKTLNPQRQSIGGRKPANPVAFVDQHLELHAGDMIFLSSDGLIDQNGYENKKFGTAKLFELLKKNSKLAPLEQKKILLAEYQSFLGNAEQRDDITLFGIKLI
jgi:serine phosphatase RsbU (regulator of sigma subunit)